jgi:hypothetical protein
MARAKQHEHEFRKDTFQYFQIGGILRPQRTASTDQTGQPISAFGEVVLKELIDNALDACESADIDPVIHIGVATVDDRLMLCVSDNGVGMSEQVIMRILDFDTRTSVEPEQRFMLICLGAPVIPAGTQERRRWVVPTN